MVVQWLYYNGCTTMAINGTSLERAQVVCRPTDSILVMER